MRTWQDGLAPHGLLAGQVLLAPLDFVHRQQYLHARGTLAHLLELGRGAGGQRERRRGRRGDPLRRQRPAGRAGGPPGRRRPAGAADRHRRACSPPTPGWWPRRRSSKRWSRSTTGSRRWPAGPGTEAGSGGHGVQAGGGQDRHLVGGGRGHRRRPARPGVLAAVVAGEPGVGTVFRARPPPAAGPQALDRLRPGRRPARWWSTRAPAGPWSTAGARCCRPGWSAVQRIVRARGRGGDRRARRRGLRQGPGPATPAGRHDEWVGRRSEDAARRPARTRSSTATTWCVLV